MKYQVIAQVQSQVMTGENICLLTLKCPEIARVAQPGQFVHLRTTSGQDPLLRRPISIFLAQPEAGLLYLWYQVVGKGTKLISQLKAGDTVDLLGPLGRGFTVRDGQRAALIGGGMGIAPLIFLGHKLSAQSTTTAFFGGRSAQNMPPTELRPSLDTILATEDGSVGRKGFVTDALASWLEKERPDILYACGPQGMLDKIYLLAKEFNIPLQVSLETTMACGVGACLGCTCEKAIADDGTWLKVCQDGPVFWAEEVKWHV